MIARVIFSPETIDEIINNYAEFSKENDTIEFEKQETLRKNIASVKQKITNIINIMATSESNSLIEALEELGTEKKKLETALAKRQTGTTAACIDENKIRKAYQLAREQFLNGTLVEKQALIFQYVNKVLIFDEHVEVYLNRLPMHLTRITELDFNHPTSGTKKYRNRAIFDSVADWVGGGEPIRTKVDNSADLPRETVKHLPKITAPLENPTYRALLIGRYTINYCYGYGDDE